MARVDPILSTGLNLDPLKENWRKGKHGRRTQGKQVMRGEKKKKGNKLNSRVT